MNSRLWYWWWNVLLKRRLLHVIHVCSKCKCIQIENNVINNEDLYIWLTMYCKMKEKSLKRNNKILFVKASISWQLLKHICRCWNNTRLPISNLKCIVQPSREIHRILHLFTTRLSGSSIMESGSSIHWFASHYHDYMNTTEGSGLLEEPQNGGLMQFCLLCLMGYVKELF